MKLNFKACCIICSMLVLFSCYTNELLREHFKTLKNRKEVTVVVFGDSISGGRGFSVTGTSYGSFMKPMFEEMLNCKVSMINSSKADDTYKLGIRRIQEDIFSYRPDVVFIMLGFVDSSTRGLIQPVFKEQVNDFLDMLQEQELFAVVLTPPGFRDIQSDDDPAIQRLKEFNEIIAYGAALHHYPSIDVLSYMEKLWLMNPEEYKSMFVDTVHLNEKGQKYVADFIVNKIKNALQE